MHLLIDARPLQGATGRRGVGGYVRLLTHGLLESRSDVKLSLLCDPRRQPPAEPPADPRSEIVWISAPPGPGLLWGRVLGRSWWKSHDADLFHSTFLSPPRMPAGAPWLATIHDLIPLRHPSGFTRRQRFVFDRSLRWAARAPRVVTVSRFTAGLVRDMLGVPARKIDVLPPPIDVERFSRPAGEEALRAVPDRPYLLHSGGFDPLKGVDELLLPAFASIVESHPDLILVLTGEGPRQRQTARVAKQLGLGSKVQFSGHVTRDSHAALVQNARAVVVSSREEGFGMPVIEAFAAGTSVAVGPARASREAAGGLAAMSRDETWQGLSEAIRGAIERADEGGDERREWAARFGAKAVASEMLDIYESVRRTETA